MKNQYIRIFYAVLFVGLLALPALEYHFQFIPEGLLYGYVEPKSSLAEGEKLSWFRRTLQQHWEENFDEHVGFKAYFIRLFNELTFRLFSEAPRINLYSTKQHGLYSKMSIDSLNDEYINQEKLTKNYIAMAKKLKELQQLLEAKGISLQVVISGSKPYVHFDDLGKRFLAYPHADIYSKIASLGHELELMGVNVIDSAPFLRQFNQKTSIETHPDSGVHWNYYAGCVVAKTLLQEAKKNMPDITQIDCGKPVYGEPHWVDIDGLLLLNILSKAHLDKPSPYPTPSAILSTHFKPKVLIVGDSFMDQMVYALDEAKVYSKLIISRYFMTRQKGVMADNNNPTDSPKQIQELVVKDALDSNLVILQMVDYNVQRYGYGFIEAMLDELKNKS
ncbi:alginate O-acetyltransferase AlgX-related protein [Legionella micdadei]|uniref:SGNH hydrolase-like domain-containing protein, acetyltransferase AlgX n=1 Tax=Legionella micdadei TaxID=451 RepID=A0A098GIQ3_LEGMI|nr:hypothetical protein [Legionella micdadei]ARG98742.1 hypothetical protein B6N58_14370 [Legionella micdadei]ARH01461.1 hypothetical protein B6V88_14235 [Legionella micdadei]KTD28965.1 hypothetical protein Lmic_0885 [Legionella micdadei]NSL17176.1 hypothetical protein [Legionella micdadei]CEG62348.1 protein of unknown function [Legionella micdadei]